MASIDYPCRLPGVLVSSNSFAPKNRVRRNDLSAGPPIFNLDDDDGFVLFNVAWRFSALEVQVFQNWYRHTTKSGSKLFNIELMVDGFDGTKNTKTHECYFDGAPSYSQVGRRWLVQATLLAIQEQILDECDADSLINAYNGFDYNLDQAIDDLDESVKLMETLWTP